MREVQCKHVATLLRSGFAVLQSRHRSDNRSVEPAGTRAGDQRTRARGDLAQERRDGVRAVDRCTDTQRPAQQRTSSAASPEQGLNWGGTTGYRIRHLLFEIHYL